MKRIALLILALAANVIADEKESIQQAYNETMQVCLNEVGMTMKEMEIVGQKLREIKDNTEEIDKEIIAKYSRVAVCFLEKEDMMKDEKLVLDKILEIHKESPTIIKEAVTKCVNSVNENNTLTREGRAFEMKVCITRAKIESK